jgi:hypothetical protein
MLPSTKRRMNLGDARSELELQGFQCFGGDEEKGILTGRRSNCRLTGSRFDLFVFVHRVTELNLEQVNKDLSNLPDRVEQYSFGGLPPFGFGRGNMIFLIYLADSIDPAASSKIRQQPNMEWCSVTFLAAQDGHGQSLFYEGTPTWGGALYPEVRYWAGLLTGRDVGSDGPPGTSKFLIALNIFCLGYLSWFLIASPISYRWFFLGSMVIWAATAWVVKLIRSSYHRTRPTQAALEVPLHGHD